MRKEVDLKNKRFSRLTVAGDYITVVNSRGKQERKWLCRCDCGNEKYVLERSLIYGGTKSCGCALKENGKKATAHRLQGMRFGELEVIYPLSTPPKDTRRGVWWHCRCSCGNEVDVLASLLATKRKTHCGCKTEPKYNFCDITGREFTYLTAKYPLNKRDRKGNVIWHCVCKCGNETDVSYNSLMYSDMRSCGCIKRKHESNLHLTLDRVDGTSIDMIKSKKLPLNNTSGTKGVGYSRGKWFAKIVFQQKQYYLGRYDNISDAIEARKEAERLLFDSAAEYYERWKELAAKDPEWAKQNTFHVAVTKEKGDELKVSFLPVI